MVGTWEMNESGQKLQASSYKLSPGDVMYSMVPMVNNTPSYI